MQLFSRLYARVMIWARHKHAAFWLALVSFSESSFFIVPPDVMLAPMTLARPDKAWFYAGLTTVMSVLGGLLGYLIGLFAFHLAEPWLISLDYMHAYQQASAWFDEWGFWAIFVAGFTPIPYKIFTIAAGAANMMLLPFVIGSIIGRGMRFFLVAGLMRWGGPQLEASLHIWVDRLGWLTVLILIIGYLLLA
ncbi:VTT domain-containing protein [uncultured Methylophaga sp.]|uniref:YqaA family protein n=1 Tax=uncultured Methylophaga sp. TaxID=285271 RepID=UPI002602C3A6|nr:VTT domain-containing protein [uncultured Methylophaga sp.]